MISCTGSSKMKDMFTFGFALFAMLFGAGNLIFPPYLGWELGDHWFLGFLFYLAVDIGFSLITVLVIANSKYGTEAITRKFGNKLSFLFVAIICICIGPAIGIPRVAAITYEVGIAPSFPHANSVICMLAFFAIVWLVCISKSGVVDIVGKFLSPIMVIALLFMIVKGIISPIGHITVHSAATTAIAKGVTSGYQTMDMMGAFIFAITLLFSIKQKGYTEKKDRVSMISYAGIIATVLLFLVYGGLTYIGATLQGQTGNISQAQLLLCVTDKLLGKPGLILLGLVVALACLTTAIGLITAIAGYFEEKLGMKYSTLVTVLTVISFVLSNAGTNTIIQLATPVLNVVYPVLIFAVFCSVAGDRVPKLGFRCGAVAAFVVSLLLQIEAVCHISLISGYLPFQKLGFGWVLPAVIGLLIGLFLDLRHKNTEAKGQMEILTEV